MEFIGKRNIGSKLVFVAVTIFDIILANVVYLAVLHSGIHGLPPYFLWHQSEGMTCITMAAVCSLMMYSSIIHRRRISVLDVFLRVARVSIVQAVILMFVLRLLIGQSQGVFRLVFFYFAAYFIAMLLARFAERSLLNCMRRLGHNSRAVVFIGSDPANLYLYNTMMSSPSVGYRVVGYYGNHEIKDAPEQFERLGSRNDLIEALRRGEDPIVADELYTALSTTRDHDDINTIMDYCDRHVIQFFLVPRIYANLNMNMTPLSVGDFTVFTNHTNNINRLDNRIEKRLFDIFVSLIVCLCMLPFIPILWVIIKLQSPGPLIFSQERTGLNGETFICYKFRSMHVNKDADRIQATKHDPRKFPFGEFMRKTNIDEMPQFFNVLKGDMSIVGPRPHMLYHTEMYSNVISKYMVRHFSKPGITGWAQVTGYRGETKEVWQMEERIKRDIWYNENWSFMLDIEIICRTALQIIYPDKNAY